MAGESPDAGTSAEAESGALAGLTVLDLTQVLAGPFCSQMLGDLGATVVKVEPPPKGDPQRQSFPMVEGVSAGYYAVNRNKRSLALDLKNPAGRAAFYRLAARADVVLENFRVGVTRRLGVDYETLRAVNPALIYASISGFGQFGPYSGMGGYDLVAQAYTGLMSATGPEGGDPVKISAPVTDVGAGLLATIGILTAHVHRLKTGVGQRVDAALFDAGIAYSIWEIVAQLHAGETPKPLGTRHRMTAPMQAFHAADGMILIAVANDGLWRRCAAAIGRPALGTDPRFATKGARRARVDELARLIEAETVKRPLAYWTERFAAAGIPCGPIRSYDQVVADPHVRARALLVDLPLPGGRGAIRVPGPPVKLSATPTAIRHPPPGLGEQTDEILAEFGFAPAEIAALREAGAVA